MAQYQDDGVVLKTRPYREADSLVTIFGLKSGKVGAVAKGARRPKSRLAAGLYPLAYSHFTLYRGRGELHTVVTAELGDAFSGLRDDLLRMGWGMVLADLVDEMFSPLDAAPEAFYLLVAGLTALGEHRDADTAGLTASWQLLRAAGFGVAAEICADCKQPLAIEGGVYLREGGVVLCRGCTRRRGADGLALSPGTLKTLSGWMATAPERMGAIRVVGGVRLEMLKWFERAATGQIGRRPRALKFLFRVLDGEGEESKR